MNGSPVQVGMMDFCWGGPFKTKKEFLDFLMEGLPADPPHHDRHYIRTALGDNHDIHLAHGDLVPRKILVDDTGHITAIVDWECSGIYPAYWGYVRLFADYNVPRLPDFKNYTQYIVPYDFVPKVLGMRWQLLISGLVIY